MHRVTRPWLPALTAVALLCLAPLPCTAQELPRQLILQGERFLNMGKYQAALNEYARVLDCCEQSPEGAEAHNDMGVACMRLGRSEEAVAHYEAAIAIADYPLAYFNLGKALLARWQDQGDPADAERARSLFGHFQTYLAQADPDSLPPCIAWQREEFDEDLEKAMRALRP